MPFSPISTTNPTTLGFGTANNLAKPPITYWGSVGVPRSTNKTWTNLVVGTGIETVGTYPYLYKADPSFLNIGYQPAISSSTTNYNMAYIPVLKALSTGTFTGKKLISQNTFGAEFAYNTATAGEEMKTWFVSGQAFTTLKYSNLTPIIRANGAILRVNTTSGASITSTTFSGQSFEIEFNNGQVWMLYSPLSISFNVTNSGVWDITLTAVYNNILKIAYLGLASEGTTTLASRRSAIDSYGINDTYVTSGSIDSTATSATSATLTFNWTKVGTNPLLHFVLPHHETTIQSPSYVNYSIRSMKGIQKAVTGDTLTFTETTTTKLWDYTLFNTPDIPAITSALATDYTFIANSDTDTYFGYKELQKMGNHAIIANQLGDTTKLNTIITNLKSKINPWLNGTNPNPMKYDIDYGGFTSSQALANGNALFGSGEYNDHHFHYGYFLQACSVIARFDPAWATATVKDKVNLYARDIFNPSTTDTYFPLYRGKDWYSGHAWAGGLSIFGDVNNQESTSEDINAWYGLMLWFESIGNTQMRDLSKVALTLSQRAAQKYWHIRDNSIYSGTFATNLMVGILWVTKCDYSTFFGGNDEYIHGIQMLPYTPVSVDTFNNTTYNTQHWTLLQNRILNRSSATSYSNLVSGTGFTGSNGSFVSGVNTFTIANNVQVTGGSGNSLLVNMNINMTAGGVIQDIYIVGTSKGTGYTDGDTVTIVSPSGGLTGGGTASFKVKTKADQGWLGMLYKQRAYTNPNDAWNLANTLTAYDNGDSKSHTLAYISQFRATTLTNPVVTTSNITNTSIDFSWLSVPTATAYEVQVTLASDTSFSSPIVTNNNVSGLNFTASGLAANTNYIYRVRAKDATPNYSGYATGSFTTTGAIVSVQTISNPIFWF